MNSHIDHETPNASGQEAEPSAFCMSRAGICLIVTIALGGLLLGFEHRVHIFGSD